MVSARKNSSGPSLNLEFLIYYPAPLSPHFLHCATILREYLRRLKSLFYLPRRKLIRFIFQNLLPPYFWINWRISLCSKKQMRINHIQVWKKLLAFVCLVVWPHLRSLDHELTKITIVWFSKSIFCVKNQFLVKTLLSDSIFEPLYFLKICPIFNELTFLVGIF